MNGGLLELAVHGIGVNGRGIQPHENRRDQGQQQERYQQPMADADTPQHIYDRIVHTERLQTVFIYAKSLL